MKRVLLAGESWTTISTHVKGFDTFVTSLYEEGGKPLIDALTAAGYQVDYLQNHRAPAEFPYTLEEIGVYDLVILSDIGSNTLLVPPEVFVKGQVKPDRCALIREYVEQGGALMMVGGYMSFTGIDAKTRYGMTDVAKVLPVGLLPSDDRVECPQGAKPVLEQPSHPIFDGIDGEWPSVLGYNKTVGGDGVLATINGDPFIAVGAFGKGRACAYTTDCSPHWAPQSFVSWQHYNRLFKNIADWLTQ